MCLSLASQGPERTPEKRKKDSSSMAAAAFLFALVSVIIAGSQQAVRGDYIKYNTSSGTVAAGKLNVHLVAHTHDDVGWLKTVDQYYVGSNNSIQGACVRNVLDSVVDALLKDPNRKFIYVEQAFFQRWWEEQNEASQEVVRKLVDSGQLEFINGGWCMHDEATTHYVDIIDQTTLGHRTIKKQFDKVPRTGWQIDPFGHSAVQGYLLGAEVGFDSIYFARIDYQDKEKRKVAKSLEMIWRGSKTFGSSSQIFAGALFSGYGPPDGFTFEVNDDFLPVQDDPLLYDFNVKERVNDFITAAITQANVTQTNHIMWTMGEDFQYQYAESWFREMDKLIHYVNKVNDDHLIVRDPDGNTVDTQFIEMDNITIEKRKLYIEAYLGVTPKTAPKYWLVFEVSVPTLGWNTYFISKAAVKGIGRNGHISTLSAPQDKSFVVGPGNFKMYFSSSSGELTRVVNNKTGVDIPIQQSYLWYGSDSDGQASGAYIFRPNGEPPNPASEKVSLKIIKGRLVDEVHQQFNSWIYQVRDHREDWNLVVTEPVAGNYFPLNLGMYITDEKYELSVLVDHAVGGSSIHDGEIEIMVHRRLMFDDSRGVGEALNEKVCVGSFCEGLTVRANYYLSIDQLGSGARWRRTIGQQIYSPLLLAFSVGDESNWKSYHATETTLMDPNYSLPPNVVILTLQNLGDETVLFRLAHLYEVGEDAEYSELTKVELKRIFTRKMIKELNETSLTTNQEKSKMRKLNWRVEEDSGSTTEPVKGGPVDNDTLIVELGPMEIRTFLLRF